MRYITPRHIIIFIVAVVCFYLVCANNGEHEAKNGNLIVVSILPQKFFVEKIGGNLVDITVMVEPGTSPHLYEPKPAQIARLSNAKLYFSIGVEFEKAWIPRFVKTAGNLTIVPCDSGIAKLPMASSHSDHGGDGEDTTETEDDAVNRDPHVWLSPERVKIIIENITMHLCLIDPVHEKDYQKNKDYFLMEIQELQDSIRLNLQESNIKQFIVFHPSWGYFANEFGLKQIPIEIEGKEPMPKELRHLIDFAKKNKITTIFVQPQFSQKTAGIIASQISGIVVPIDPLAYHWDTNLLSVTNALVGR